MPDITEPTTQDAQENPEALQEPTTQDTQELPEALQKKQERLDKQEEQLKKQEKNIKKIKRKNKLMFVLNALFTAVFVALCFFSMYRRYDEIIIYDKPAEIDSSQTKTGDNLSADNANSADNNQLDKNQQKTTEPPTQAETPAKADSEFQTPTPENAETENPDNNKGHFTIYSVGDVYTAENGSGELHCDVRNTEDSTHDIIMSIYITEDELRKHKLSTDGVEDGQWLIAQSGMFEPGYQINSVQLLKLPDGSYLPAGTYEAIMNEKYYHHLNGTLSSYEANIPVTVEVAN